MGPSVNVEHVIKREKVVTVLFLLKVTQSYTLLCSQKENLFARSTLSSKTADDTKPSSQSLCLHLCSPWFFSLAQLLLLFHSSPLHSENSLFCLLKLEARPCSDACFHAAISKLLINYQSNRVVFYSL